MNTAIASTRNAGPGDPGGFMGLGFAIPVRMAVDVAARILDTGEVQRGYLGVYIRDVTPDLAYALGFDGQDGVLIEHAIGDGPADGAGLAPGDILTHVGEYRVDGVDDLRYRIAAYDPGQEVRVTAVRDGDAARYTVRLDELPPAPSRSRLRPRSVFVPIETAQLDDLRALGVERVADFTPEDAAGEGFNPIAGVMIVDVRPGSIAARERLRPQAIITRLNGTRIETVDDLRAALDAADAWSPLLVEVRYWDFEAQEFVTRFALLGVDDR
jgi:serine protease Do